MPIKNENFKNIRRSQWDLLQQRKVFSYRCVCQFEEHRVDNVEPGELVQGRGGQNYFPALFQIVPLVARHHGDGVASVLGLEGPGRLPKVVHAEHGGGVSLELVPGEAAPGGDAAELRGSLLLGPAGKGVTVVLGRIGTVRAVRSIRAIWWAGLKRKWG